VKISVKLGLRTYPFAAYRLLAIDPSKLGGLLESATNSSIEGSQKSKRCEFGETAEISTLTIDSTSNFRRREETSFEKPFIQYYS